ncbi:MAG TPA: ATP-binding cassette domain-containing protein [Patescibacteria group bacterium]|nr:ATP-binding cassette domain-containing protein [Patescibacteria group bacterium]
MSFIRIRNARVHNLKNISVDIPLKKLVIVVGKSGSGKSSLVHDVLERAAEGCEVNARISGCPNVHSLEQRVIPDGERSLGETSLFHLRSMLKQVQPGELFIADEPCAGMAKEDCALVLKLLRDALRKGISIIVVEHNPNIISGADYIIEFGPDSGVRGGEIVFQGTLAQFRRAKTATSIPVFSHPPSKPRLTLKTARVTISRIEKNNFHQFSFSFPINQLVCVTGRMGTGKSTLLSVAYGALFKGKDAWKYRHGFAHVDGKTHIRRSYFVDQSLLSSNPKSTPATLLGIWTALRRIGPLSDAKKRELEQKTVDQIADEYEHIAFLKRKLGFLQEVGLGYLELGQQSNSLSGGEAQRVRLAKILSKKLGDRCLYLLDIPSRGLHLSDLPVLIRVLRKIVEKRNTVLIAENQQMLINECDEVISL